MFVMNVKKKNVFVAALAVGMAVTGAAADPWALGVNPYDFLVYDPKMPQKYEECKPTDFGDRYNCHFQVIYDAKRKAYFAFWTQATNEKTATDMHIAFSKSTDLEAGWTEPIVLGGNERQSESRPMAYWQQPMLSKKGRLYCLWNQQVGTNRCHYGVMRGRYSDDAGEHWSPAEDAAAWPTNVLRRWGMPADTPPHWCIWQRPLRFGPDNSFYVSVTHGSCRVGFLNYTNIDENPEIPDIGFRFFHATSDTYLKGPKGGSCCEEASIVKLPDGRLFALLRSRMGHPLWTQSRDGGCTWQAPRPLEKPNGEKFLHCCSPCPMYDWKGCEAGSGTYFALIHNTYDFKKKNQPRGPLYLIAGTFDPTGEQPVRFSEPKLFAPRPNGNAFYASYTVDENGVGILWFCDMKRWLLGRKIGSEWLCP